MKLANPEMLLTASSLAREVGRSLDWVRAQSDLGRIPCRRDTDNRRLFEPQAVDVALRLIRSRNRA